MTLQSPDLEYNFYLRLQGDTSYTLVDNPDGWQDMVTTIKRSKELKGVFVTMDVQFTFERNGHDFLRTVFDASDYCAIVEILIDQSRDAGNNYKEFYNGIIKISDVVFDKKFRTAETKVLDNSFFANIYENKSLEATVIAGKSKNDVDITIPTLYPVEMFDPQTGTAVTAGAGGATGVFFKAYDLLKYMVAFMSDGEVAFDSTLFGVGGEREYTMMTFGKVIRRIQAGYTRAIFDTDIPVLAFQKLFKELDVKENLGLFIDNSGGRPTLRIEKWDDLFKNNVALRINNIDHIKERISTQDIYSALKLGSAKTFESFSPGSFPETIKFIGFNDEKYTIVGKCNIDKTLDLSGDFIVSSNIIREILVQNTGDTTWDEDWFIVDSEFTGGQIKAKKTNWLLTAPPYYYNEYYINSNVAQRYLKAVPNSIANILGNADNTFMATLTSDKTFAAIDSVPNPTFGNIPYDDETNPPNKDPSGNYDPVLFEYVAPASGVYVFEALTDTETIPQFPSPRATVYLMVHDSLGAVKYVIVNPQDAGFDVTYNPFVPYAPILSTWNALLSTGDKVSVQIFNISGSSSDYIVKAGSYFKCTNSATGGGVYQTYDPADYPVYQDDFEETLLSEDFDKIIADPLALIAFSDSSINHINGWCDQIKFNHKKQKATYTMTSSKNSR